MSMEHKFLMLARQADQIRWNIILGSMCRYTIAFYCIAIINTIATSLHGNV